MRKSKRPKMVDERRPVKRSAGRGVSKANLVLAGSSTTLPDWGALSGMSTKRRARSRIGFFSTMTTARFAKWLFGMGIAVTLYVGHVHSTQSLYEQLHAVRKENLRLHMERDRLKGEFDHATGPTIIYPRAHALGLDEGFEYGGTLTIQP